MAGSPWLRLRQVRTRRGAHPLGCGPAGVENRTGDGYVYQEPGEARPPVSSAVRPVQPPGPRSTQTPQTTRVRPPGLTHLRVGEGGGVGRGSSTVAPPEKVLSDISASTLQVPSAASGWSSARQAGAAVFWRRAEGPTLPRSGGERSRGPLIKVWALCPGDLFLPRAPLARGRASSRARPPVGQEPAGGRGAAVQRRGVCLSPGR